MFLYPLAIVLMLLTFLSPLFNHSRVVYVSATAVTFLISVMDGLKTFYELFEIPYFGWMSSIISFYERFLPLYSEGLGWLVPVLVVILVTGAIGRFHRLSIVEA